MSTSDAMDLHEQRNEIIRIAARHGAGNLRVFGSVARGDAGPESDVDLLVDMESDRSFLDLVGLGQDLEELLHRKVDVLTDESLHPMLRQRILAEARPLSKTTASISATSATPSETSRSTPRSGVIDS